MIFYHYVLRLGYLIIKLIIGIQNYTKISDVKLMKHFVT
jgi:hypothetical protein